MCRYIFYSAPPLRVNDGEHGFTLIELSIVLVIIGLIVGGIVVGKDLISAAAMRAQISQIDKFNMAVHAFLTKYNALPGDIPEPKATNFGFTPRGIYAGEGDGNGLIEGIFTNAVNGLCDFCGTGGENAMFWVDLTYANGMNINLINGSFITATPTGFFNTTAIASFLPAAAIGQNNYIMCIVMGLTTILAYLLFQIRQEVIAGVTVLLQLQD